MKKRKKGNTRLLYLTHHPELSGHQDQIGHRSCHQQLEQGLGASEIARLSYAKLYQSGQTMFGDREFRIY